MLYGVTLCADSEYAKQKRLEGGYAAIKHNVEKLVPISQIWLMNQIILSSLIIKATALVHVSVS